MKRLLSTLVVLSVSLVLVAGSATPSQAGFGVGLHYLNTVGDMKDIEGFDSSALGFMGVYSFGSALLNFEAGVEWVPNYAFEKDMIQPQFFAFIGEFIYGGIGIGIGHIDSEWQDKPFFALRAGVKVTVFDLFASYRFQNMKDIDDLDSDSLDAVTFGALFKF